MVLNSPKKSQKINGEQIHANNMSLHISLSDKSDHKIEVCSLIHQYIYLFSIHWTYSLSRHHYHYCSATVSHLIDSVSTKVLISDSNFINTYSNEYKRCRNILMFKQTDTCIYNDMQRFPFPLFFVVSKYKCILKFQSI